MNWITNLKALRLGIALTSVATLALSCVPAPATPDDPSLRPNVQEGEVANAIGQQPAFDGQTRAPQPATATDFSVVEVAGGLERPWGLALLPDGSLLVTERPGRLKHVNGGDVSGPINGVPNVLASGQGGLLDVAVSPEFAEDRLVFLSLAEARDDDLSGAAIARGVLSEDHRSLDDVTVIYRQEPAWSGGRHFGSRIVFDDDGKLFATFGDRGSAFDEAQDPGNAIGAVIRLNKDGSIPDDNPFADGGEGAPEIWSWGHRNIQAATLGRDGALWTVEHGPAGGDELNKPAAGVNHGWPIISYGRDYTGLPIGFGRTEQEGMAQPVYYWDPVIAPSGMATYTGALFEGWEGDLLVGGLVAQAVVRLTIRDDEVYTEEWLEIGQRVRDIAVDSDGSILIITDATDGAVLRLVPN